MALKGEERATPLPNPPPQGGRESTELAAHTSPNPPELLRRLLRRRVDHLAHFGDLGRGKSADLGVLADDGFVLGEIDAERLVVGDIALDPLDVGAELMQDLI